MTCLLLVAAALVAVLAVAGMGAGAELHVYPGGSIQTTIDDAGGCDLCACGDVCGECECVETDYADRRWRGCGGGAGVGTTDTKMFM
ncbi:MAG: hypothetical protein C4B59_10405 [Candidatus Methanogaster sp.]|uniref:Uncharacterized protein n=1 Tax=Candidatus Methanogaster sp. TaxID=3386292 RepID=A0AC61L1F0_9EURY|nr:MAG: hypothetical protein C4B59_10405 [ANME-2 cluster archaeon]